MFVHTLLPNAPVNYDLAVKELHSYLTSDLPILGSFLLFLSQGSKIFLLGREKHSPKRIFFFKLSIFYLNLHSNNDNSCIMYKGLLCCTLMWLWSYHKITIFDLGSVQPDSTAGCG